MGRAPAIFAHRLGGAYGPESGRSALRRTLDGPVAGVETDVVLTADLEVLALHDPILSLSTDLEGWAHEHDAATVCAARLLDQDGEASEDRPMRLAELLELVPPQLRVQLDVKAYADAGLATRTAQRCCEIVREHKAESRIELISFFSEACSAAVAHGLAARLVIWADYDPDALTRWLTDHGLVGISVEGFILTPRLVSPLAEAGLTLSVGAVNERIQLERVLAFRPEVVVSDSPHELLEMTKVSS